jgi:hypothetical protein
MAKKNHRVDYDDDDSEYRNDYYQEVQARRKDKRMRNALRSRNVDDLMRNFDDDYDMY